MTTHAAASSWTTPGRHRREVGTGRIRLVLDAGWTDTDGLEVTVNGHAVVLAGRETTIQVPVGPMHVDLRGARADFVVGEDEVAELSATASRPGLPGITLTVAGQGV